MNAPLRPKRLLVTGSSGFVGQALAAWLPQSRWSRHFQIVTPAIDYDLRDADQLRQAIGPLRAECVLHLAAQSFVPASFQDPAGTLAVNVGGTLNLLQALETEGFGGRFLYVSSADIYGAVEESALPVTETRLPVPRNPYAVSKASAEMLCRQWHLTQGMEVVIARPFNHTGPGQDARFILSGFARSIANILSAGASAPRPRIETGNLAVTRDFSDVRDVLDAYMTILHDGHVGETYNVCSGVERNVGEILQGMLARAGVCPDVVTDAARLRPNEQLRMVGSAAKLQAHTGWTAQCDLEATLSAMVAWWQAKGNK